MPRLNPEALEKAKEELLRSYEFNSVDLAEAIAEAAIRSYLAALPAGNPA